MHLSDESISRFFLEIAETYGLEKWDWIAICIALSSFIVAGCTLASQIKTQINTTPSFTKASQKLVLSDITYRMIENFCKLCAIKYFMEKKNYNVFFVRRILFGLRIPSDQLHLELTYNNKRNYFAFSSFKKSLDNYNELLTQFQSNCEGNLVKSETVRYELNHLIYYLTQIIDISIDLYVKNIPTIFFLRKTIRWKKAKYSRIIEQFLPWYRGQMFSNKEIKVNDDNYSFSNFIMYGIYNLESFDNDYFEKKYSESFRQIKEIVKTYFEKCRVVNFYLKDKNLCWRELVPLKERSITIYGILSCRTVHFKLENFVSLLALIGLQFYSVELNESVYMVSTTSDSPH